ncbi:MAG: 4-hydroxy-tetrahydrodipicolinate synthase [Actinomycetota bacterium]|nr:4-hydroxy-tetrahydrodipicolinate synthase [Actinomycetota bacterium]
MTGPRFGSLLTAMVTPFASDGSLNVDGARKLASHLVDNGSEGLVVAGTTGESPVLSHKEKLDLFAAVLEEVGNRAKVIAGTGSPNTEETIEMTKEVGVLGVDAALVVTPYYSRPPQNGLLAHYRAVADASSVPLMLYDIPVRTGRRVEIETMVELAGHPNIVANKDAVGDAAETRKLRAELDAAGHTDFEIYSGDDPMLIEHLDAGVVGIVSVCSHLIGPHIAQVISDHKAGETDDAQQAFAGLVEFMRVIMGLTASPIPVKYATGLLGLDVGDPRLPNVPPTEQEAKTIRSAMEKLGLL